MATPQPGIFAQGTRAHYHLEFDLQPGVSEASIYQQFMVVRAELQDRHTDKVLWSNVLSSIDQFPVVSSTVVTTSPQFLQQNLRSQDIANLPDIQVAQTQQAASSTQMMTKMAQNIYSAMSEGF